jgi:hypothetical protein
MVIFMLASSHIGRKQDDWKKTGLENSDKWV